MVEHPRGLGVDALGGRVNLSDVAGTIAATIDQASDDAEPTLSASFDGVRAGVAFDGLPVHVVDYTADPLADRLAAGLFERRKAKGGCCGGKSDCGCASEEKHPKKHSHGECCGGGGSCSCS